MNRITEWLRRQVESVRRTKEVRRVEEINARFSVRERDGKIFLLCNGTAVAIMTPACRCKAGRYKTDKGNEGGSCLLRPKLTRL